MGCIKMRSLWLAVIMGLGGVLVSIGLLGVSPALAQELGVAGSEGLALPRLGPNAPPSIITLDAVLTYTGDISITNLAGNVVGQGQHGGRVRCNTNSNCSQATQLQLNGNEYEYKFRTRQAVDPDARRAIVEGTGTIARDGQKERFTFTATFQDNRDGTLSVTYVASRPDASFIIPESPGTFSISSRR